MKHFEFRLICTNRLSFLLNFIFNNCFCLESFYLTIRVEEVRSFALLVSVIYSFFFFFCFFRALGTKLFTAVWKMCLIKVTFKGSRMKRGSRIQLQFWFLTEWQKFTINEPIRNDRNLNNKNSITFREKFFPKKKKKTFNRVFKKKKKKMLQIFYILQRCSFPMNMFRRSFCLSPSFSLCVLLKHRSLKILCKFFPFRIEEKGRIFPRKVLRFSTWRSIALKRSLSNDGCKSSSEYFVVEPRRERERKREREKKQRTSARLTTGKIHVGEIFGAKVSTYDHDWSRKLPLFQISLHSLQSPFVFFFFFFHLFFLFFFVSFFLWLRGPRVTNWSMPHTRLRGVCVGARVKYRGPLLAACNCGLINAD